MPSRANDNKKTDKAEFVLIADEGKAVPQLKITVENNRVECDYRGYSYSVSASKGRLCKNRAVSEGGILQIDFTRREE